MIEGPTEQSIERVNGCLDLGWFFVHILQDQHKRAHVEYPFCSDELVMLKLTLPETDGLYAACIAHPNVARVVALSGGYTREEANERLSRQAGMVASFSRALSEGLNAAQSDDKFNATLDSSIASIAAASAT